MKPFLFFCILCVIISNKELAAQFRTDSIRQYQLIEMQSVGIDSFASLSLGTLESFQNINKSIGFLLLPLKVGMQFNSNRPFGSNNSGFTFSNGFQSMATAGFSGKLGLLNIQLRPEIYLISNNYYATTNSFGYNTKSNSKIYGGQSEVSLRLNKLNFGVSTQNLWWGPGQFSALMLSNNAPGFPHITLNSTKPIKTALGHFEFQIIWAKLFEDSTLPAENFRLKPRLPKNSPRFLNGIVVTYQPKILKGVFFGVTRMTQLYISDQKTTEGFINKWLPALAPSTPAANANTSSIPSDGTFSFFSRWLFPKYKLEFYAEYGYNDFKQNLRDASVNTNHASAFLLGFKKIFKTSGTKFWDLSGELTQLSQTPSFVIRNAGNWYEHGAIEAGLTFQNQILGSGAMMGNNLQTIQLRHLTGFDQWGIKLQRIQQDPKGLTTSGISVPNLGMRPYQWNDIVLGFLGQKKLSLNKTGSMVLNGEVNFVFARNYGWEKGNKFNLFTSLHATYFF